MADSIRRLVPGQAQRQVVHPISLSHIRYRCIVECSFDRLTRLPSYSKTAIIERVGLAARRRLAHAENRIMRRALRVVHCCVLFCAVLFEGWTSNAQDQSVNVLRGTPSNQRIASPSIPVPPQQTAVWNAPETKLPKEFASAACTLFRQGLADPRGCQYCAIELSAGNHVSGDDRVISTHGWLIPSGATEGPCFAICWNGVVYPVVTRKGGADLRADVLNAVKAERKARRAQLDGNWRTGGVPSASRDEGSLEIAAVCHQSPKPLWACLLLRLGEVELAEKSWAACARSSQGLAARRKHPRTRTWIWRETGPGRCFIARSMPTCVGTTASHCRRPRRSCPF